MKLLVVLSAFIALCAGSAIPLVPGDNSHYVEGESRYIWMPDGEGIPILVDLQEEDSTPDNDFMRNGARNEYWLFTRNNPTSRQVLVHGDIESIFKSNYRNNRPIVVIVHGWRSNGNSKLNPLITEALLATGDYNVIVLDWRRLAGAVNYIRAARGVPEVGRYLGDFLEWLIETTGNRWDRVHLIGHSLGAHVVGNAGRQTGGRIARITGLDPAGPIWGGNSDCLANTDAQYVEAIHTDGGSLGIFDKIVDADFYPNGGRNPQPGCWISTCSHSHAYNLFAASIWHDHLVGYACDGHNFKNCNGRTLNMGNSKFSKKGSGIYYLTTQRNWPY